MNKFIIILLLLGFGIAQAKPYPYHRHISSASQKYGIDSLLIASIIKIESRFHANSKSKCGCNGLMQVKGGSFNPRKNIFQGTGIFKHYLKKNNGDTLKALGSYNRGYAGYKRYYKRHGHHSKYVSKVMTAYNNLLTERTNNMKLSELSDGAWIFPNKFIGAVCVYSGWNDVLDYFRFGKILKFEVQQNNLALELAVIKVSQLGIKDRFYKDNLFIHTNDLESHSVVENILGRYKLLDKMFDMLINEPTVPLISAKQDDKDNWGNMNTLVCATCMYFLKNRCRRNAPTIKGFPAVFPTDYCGEHKMTKAMIDKIIAERKNNA